MNSISKSDLQQLFEKTFQTAPELIVRSPGRINIIGEHTDYNNGFVLPAAISQAVYVAFKKREDDQVRLYAVEYEELVETNLHALAPAGKWTDYILGVADQLLKAGSPLTGFDLVMTGNIPMGAGLSSSAAIECAVVFGLSELFQLGLEKLEMVKIAQAAEHAFAGVRCGIMDMFASMFGKKDQAILLDCRSLDYKYVPLTMEGSSIVLFNSNVKHSLASSEYNLRREQCEEGVQILQSENPQIKDLRDVSSEMLSSFKSRMPELIFRRCNYVVEENQRVLAACKDLEKHDMAAMGEKLFRAHLGLSKEYEVSCPELDFLIETAHSHPAVLGARMVGGGFGGCTINLIESAFTNEVIQRVSEAYERGMDKAPEVYRLVTDGGTSLL
jgi:galactokinase